MSDEKKEFTGRRYAPVHGASCARLEPWATGDWVRYADFLALQRELAYAQEVSEKRNQRIIELLEEKIKERDQEWNAAIEEATELCIKLAMGVGNVDGHDYRSGEEFGHRKSAVEISKLKRPA